MQVSSQIDWISLTFPFREKSEKMLPDGFEYEVREINSPIPVYKQAFEVLPLKAKILIGNERIGNHMILSGKSMNELYEFEVNLQSLYEKWISAHAHFSRIDLAVDVFDCEDFTPSTVENEFFTGHCETRFTRNKDISENRQTETFYLGKLDSKIAKFRVYNKALEQDFTGLFWTRVEYEKRKNATQWAKAIFEQGQSIKSLIKSSVNFPDWKLWNEIFDAPDGRIPRAKTQSPEDVETMLAWILSSAVPAIAKAIITEAKETNDKFSLNDCRVVRVINSALEYQLKTQLFEQKFNSVSTNMQTLDNRLSGVGEADRSQNS